MANRQDYITGIYLKMHEAGMPLHMLKSFIDEAAARPDEYPTISKAIVETYPDAAAWEAHSRTCEGGILHWHWQDGSGFPPHPPRKE